MNEAKARKERLAALRQAAELGGGDAAVADDKSDKQDKPVLKFRNYAVKDDRIEHTKVEPARPQPFEDPSPKPDKEKGPLDEVVIEVAPKKANWDLKRDIAKKLDKLERRTHHALLELMRDEEKRRFAEDGGIADNDYDLPEQ